MLRLRRRPDLVSISGTGPAPGKRPRDARIDAFRGIALLMIFINHVPGNPYEYLTIRNVGFSDAAEAFFLMSGIAAGIAYTGGFLPAERQRAGLWRAIAPLWRRAWSLYLVHIALSAAALAIFATAYQISGLPELLRQINMSKVFETPAEALIGIPILTHQFGYVNILPAYSVLLVCAPVAILVGLRWPRALLAGSLAIWMIGGMYRVNLPNYPNEGGWFFNPVSWQALFVIGLIAGLSARQNKTFYPASRWLFWLSAAVLAFVVAWIYVPGLGPYMNHKMHEMRMAGGSFLFFSYDKTFLSLPRFLHILALGYFLSQLPIVLRACAHRFAAPIRLLGRHGLLIFSAGTVISLICQAALLVAPDAGWMSWVLPPVGVALLFAIAKLAEIARTPRARPGVRAVTEPVPNPVSSPVPGPLPSPASMRVSSGQGAAGLRVPMQPSR